MKVIFTASQRGKKVLEAQYRNIINEIKALGYENLSDDLLNVDSDEFYKNLQEGGREANVNLYKKKIKNLQEADICIFECSTHSLSIGFVIQKSLDFNKPTIVLYYQDNIPHFLSGIDDEKLIVKSYNDDNLKDVLKLTIDEATDLRDKRFNFFISPELLTYLEAASKKLNITKSNFIRNLIQEHRRKYGLKD